MEVQGYCIHVIINKKIHLKLLKCISVFIVSHVSNHLIVTQVYCRDSKIHKCELDQMQQLKGFYQKHPLSILNEFYLLAPQGSDISLSHVSYLGKTVRVGEVQLSENTVVLQKQPKSERIITKTTNVIY